VDQCRACMRSIVIRMSVRLSVCLSLRSHNPKNHMAQLHRIFVHVDSGLGSVLVWRRCDTLCTSGLVAVVMFSRNAPYKTKFHGSSFLVANVTRMSLHMLRVNWACRTCYEETAPVEFRLYGASCVSLNGDKIQQAQQPRFQALCSVIKTGSTPWDLRTGGEFSAAMLGCCFMICSVKVRFQGHRKMEWPTQTFFTHGTTR